MNPRVERRILAWRRLAVLAWWVMAGWGRADAADGFRVQTLGPAGAGTPGFTVVPSAASGIAFTNTLATSRFVTNQIHLNGSGVALGDVDGDGKCDVFLAGLDGPNGLYRNLGDWRFTNIAATAGVALPSLDASGAALADLDGDRDLDLVLNTVGQGTHVLINDGGGRFTPAPGSPYNAGRGGMSLAVADTDGDGDLDVYVANYRTDTFRDQPGTRFRGRNQGGRMVLQTVNGRPVTDPDLEGRYTILPSGVIEEHGEGDVFLRNEGGGRFAALGVADGVLVEENGQPLAEPPYDWTLAVAFRDLNGDGAPDLYLCNDFSSPDELWINDGRGRFRRSPRVALRHTPMFSMGVDFADLDGDGWDEFFVVDMLGMTHAKRHTQLGDTRAQFLASSAVEARPQYSFNQLFKNRGDGTFAEIGWYAGVMATDWTWNPMFLDVDLDGREDLLLGTGHELEMMDADIGERTEQMRKRQGITASEIQRLKLQFPRHNVPNVALRNLGGMRFGPATTEWRFGLPVISTGMAMADLDGDGDADVVLNNLNDGATLLRNDAPASRVAVRLRGRAPNTHGIGARIRVVAEGQLPQTQEIAGGGRYLSSDAPERTFACGAARSVEIEVRWRGGGFSRIPRAEPGGIYEIDEPETSDSPVNPPNTTAAENNRRRWFEDLTSGLAHRHVEESFDDFAVQPLLPTRLSGLGPAVVWADLDGDDDDDLWIGGGRGGRIQILRNEAGKAFAPAAASGALERDALGLLVSPGSRVGGPPAVWASLSNWEDGSSEASALARVDLEVGTISSVLPAGDVMAGMMVLADWDADGDLDGFVAGRAVPARYPEPSKSWIWRNDAGQVRVREDDEASTRGWGPTTGAAAVDLTGDGFPELVTAGDWGPIRILRNERGRFVAWDPEVDVREALGPAMKVGRRRLSELTGCWGGLAPGDLDGDGRMDLVIGNWGRNSRWEWAGDRPLRLYYGDYDENGALDVLEAVYVSELGDYAPLRNWKAVTGSMPFVRETAPTHDAFGKATVAKVLGDARMARTRYVEAATLSSVMLLNRGNSWEARALPPEAQWSPVFGVVVADFDTDGRADVFLAQNVSGVHGDAARQDAGMGWILRGVGDGRLESVSATATGIRIHGDARGAAVSDYDGDGRVDLAVGQNSMATRLFRNVGERSGLRVRLRGPAGNPAGFGATLAVVRGERRGPEWSVGAGSGWISQNSAVCVLGAVEAGDVVEVRWPGGATNRILVPSGAREIEVKWAGAALLPRPETWELTDLEGRKARVMMADDTRAVVVVFLGVDCPIANRCLPELAALERELSSKGVRFLHVYPNSDETSAVVRRHRVEYRMTAEAYHDAGQRLAAVLDAHATPEAVAMTRDGRLIYRGRVNDQYAALGVSRPEATRHDLAEALRRFEEDARPTGLITPTVGCIFRARQP